MENAQKTFSSSTATMGDLHVTFVTLYHLQKNLWLKNLAQSSRKVREKSRIIITTSPCPAGPGYQALPLETV